MNEELRDTLEVQGEESVHVEPVLQEEVIITEPEVEYEMGDNIHVEPVIEIEAEPQPEAVLEQSADGVWRHTDDSPFSPFYVPDKKEKKGNRITIALSL